MSSQLMQMRSAHYGMMTLLAGYTTVREAGSRSQEMYALRDGINNGWIDGPRIIAAGGVGITGGHADISGVRPALMEFYTDESICDGPYDCRRATRNAIKYGADLIKITSTGGVLTDRATGTGQQMALNTDVLSESQKVKALQVGADMMGNFAKAYKAGVKVAYGTDSGVSRHGTNAREAVLMVEAGMSEMAVIKSATVSSADLIDMSDSIGTIEAGKYADIIAVDGSPLQNIEELLDVDFVMKGGKVYKQ